MDLDKLLEPVEVPKQQPCKVIRLIEPLEGKYREAVENMLKKKYVEGGLTDDAIASRLVSAGLPVGATTIRRHRANLCQCKDIQ